LGGDLPSQFFLIPFRCFPWLPVHFGTLPIVHPSWTRTVHFQWLGSRKILAQLSLVNLVRTELGHRNSRPSPAAVLPDLRCLLCLFVPKRIVGVQPNAQLFFVELILAKPPFLGVFPCLALFSLVSLSPLRPGIARALYKRSSLHTQVYSRAADFSFTLFSNPPACSTVS